MPCNFLIINLLLQHKQQGGWFSVEPTYSPRWAMLSMADMANLEDPTTGQTVLPFHFADFEQISSEEAAQAGIKEDTLAAFMHAARHAGGDEERERLVQCVNVTGKVPMGRELSFSLPSFRYCTTIFFFFSNPPLPRRAAQERDHRRPFPCVQDSQHPSARHRR